MDSCDTPPVQSEVHLSPSVGGGCILTARRPGRFVKTWRRESYLTAMEISEQTII